MYGIIKEKDDGSIKKITIQMDNGDVFHIEEDIENHIVISKDYSSDCERLNTHPRYANQITVH